MKERILIVNKFYYPRGGDCICAMGLENLLRANGHEVAVFAMDFPENQPSEWQKYFPSQVDFSGPVSAKLKAARRVMGDSEVRKKFNSLLDSFRPDVVHLHNIHSYISPLVAKIARARGIPVVWTMHDYKLLCPTYSFLCRGEICEKCLVAPFSVVRERCMKGSLPASIIAYLEERKWNLPALERLTDTFISPSMFLKRKLESQGVSPDRTAYLINFLPPSRRDALTADNSRPDESRPYACYIGRLSEEKGVRSLLEAASRLPYRLKIAGGGPLEAELREKYSACDNIEFLGFCDAPQVISLLRGAHVSVVPSQWYENNPISIIESHSCGTPVVGAQIGGIPELIDSDNGITYRHDSPEALAEALRSAFSRRWDRDLISARAAERFSAEKHYAGILEIYRNAIARHAGPK